MTKLLLFISLIIICSQSLAEKIEVTVVGAEFPPYFTDTPPLYGITGTVIQHIFNDSKFTPQLRVKPFARALTEAKNGTSDIIVALYKTQEREKQLNYSDSLISSNIFLYTNATNNRSYDSLEDLSNKRVGLIRQTSTRLSISNNPKIQLTYINHYLQGLEMVKLGRLDFMVGNEIVIQYLLNKEEHKSLKENIKAIHPELMTENTYIAVSKLSPHKKQLLNTLNQGISKLKENHQLQRIIGEHLNSQ